MCGYLSILRGVLWIPRKGALKSGYVYMYEGT